MSSKTFETKLVAKFPISAQVTIDGAEDIVGVVTGIAFYSERSMFLVDWIHNGVAQAVWFDSWRLREWKP